MFRRQSAAFCFSLPRLTSALLGRQGPSQPGRWDGVIAVRGRLRSMDQVLVVGLSAFELPYLQEATGARHRECHHVVGQGTYCMTGAVLTLRVILLKRELSGQTHSELV